MSRYCGQSNSLQEGERLTAGRAQAIPWADLKRSRGRGILGSSRLVLGHVRRNDVRRDDVRSGDVGLHDLLGNAVGSWRLKRKRRPSGRGGPPAAAGL